MGMVTAVGSQLVQAVPGLEGLLLDSGPTFYDTAPTAAAANSMAKAVVIELQGWLGFPYTSNAYKKMKGLKLHMGLCRAEMRWAAVRATNSHAAISG